MTRTSPLVILAVAVAVMLSACDPDESGAAAIVGDTRISESSVNEAAVEAIRVVESQPPGTVQEIDQSVLLSQNVTRLVNSRLLEIAAAEEGVVVSQTEVDKIVAQASSGASSQAAFEAGLAVQAGVPPSAIDSFARDFLLRQALGQKLDPSGDSDAQLSAAYARLEQVAKEVGVTVSPRYGTWDAANHAVVGPSNDLSVTPSPAVSGQ